MYTAMICYTHQLFDFCSLVALNHLHGLNMQLLESVAETIRKKYGYAIQKHLKCNIVRPS